MPPDIPTPIDSLFPRDAMRKGQHEFYQDAKTATREGKILFADAPTGIGKTAASLSALLEEAIPQNRKVIFLTNRNSHHMQAIIETIAIERNRKTELQKIRPHLPRIKTIDKISKHRMCLLLYGKEGERPPFLRCEIARCQYQTPKKEDAQKLLAQPISASEATKLGVENGFCGHQTAILASQEADLIICDYSYLFSPQISSIMLAKMGVALPMCDVIVDEAHNLPKRVRDINEHKIDEDTLKKAMRGLNEVRKIAAERQDEEMGRLTAFLARHLRTVVSPGIKIIAYEDMGEEERGVSAEALRFLREKGAKLGEEEREPIPQLMDKAAALFSAAVSQSKPEDVDYDSIMALKGLSAFLRAATEVAWGRTSWGVFIKRGEDGFSLRATLYDPGEVAADVFAQVHSAVLMSGTLSGKEAIRELLGIDAKRTLGLDKGPYESPFERSRQPIAVCAAASSRFADRGDEGKVGQMAQIIEKAAKACHPHSMAIYYPSYEFMDRVLTRTKLEGYAIEREGPKEDGRTAAERKKKLESHGPGQKPIAFNAVMGAKYNEGVDFLNNPFKLIILAGFPYPKKSSAHVAYEEYLAKKLGDKEKAHQYSALYPAAVSAMQTLGRGIRQPTDWCYCLLVDDRFDAHRRFFPKEVARRMQMVKADEVEGEISAFVKRMERGKEEQT